MMIEEISYSKIYALYSCKNALYNLNRYTREKEPMTYINYYKNINYVSASEIVHIIKDTGGDLTETGRDRVTFKLSRVKFYV